MNEEIVRKIAEKSNEYYRAMIKKHATPFQKELFERCEKEKKPYPFDDIQIIIPEPRFDTDISQVDKFAYTFDICIKINGVEHFNEAYD